VERERRFSQGPFGKPHQTRERESRIDKTAGSIWKEQIPVTGQKRSRFKADSLPSKEMVFFAGCAVKKKCGEWGIEQKRFRRQGVKGSSSGGGGWSGNDSSDLKCVINYTNPPTCSEGTEDIAQKYFGGRGTDGQSKTTGSDYTLVNRQLMHE